MPVCVTMFAYMGSDACLMKIRHVTVSLLYLEMVLLASLYGMLDGMATFAWSCIATVLVPKGKVHLLKESAIYLRHLYVAINLGCSSESGYYDGDRDGCHWALLFADLEKCMSNL